MTRHLFRPLAWLGRILCEHDVHRVALWQRYYDPELAGGYVGHCIRCDHFPVTVDKSGGIR